MLAEESPGMCQTALLLIGTLAKNPAFRERALPAAIKYEPLREILRQHRLRMTVLIWFAGLPPVNAWSQILRLGRKKRRSTARGAICYLT